MKKEFNNKTYKITYIGMLGESTKIIKTPNKTIARQIFIGEMNPGCKIIKIDEIFPDTTITTTSIFMALKKEHLLKYCQENNIKVFKSWNKSKIVEAMIKEQNLKDSVSSDENKEVENLKEKYIKFAQSLDVKTYQKYRRISLLDDYLVDCFNLHYSKDIIDFIEFMHNEVVENGKLINFPYDFKSSNIPSKLIGGLYLPTIINFEKSYDDNFYTFSFFVNENLTNQVFICGDNENGKMKITTNFNQFSNLDIKTIEKYIQDKFNKFKDENLQQLESKNNNIIDNRDKKEITIKTCNLTMVAKYHDRYSKILDKTYSNEVYEYCLMNSKNEIIYQSGNNLSILIYEEEGYISIKSYIDEVVYALENNLISLIENFMYLNGVGSTIHAIRKHKNIV